MISLLYKSLKDGGESKVSQRLVNQKTNLNTNLIETPIFSSRNGQKVSWLEKLVYLKRFKYANNSKSCIYVLYEIVAFH